MTAPFILPSGLKSLLRLGAIFAIGLLLAPSVRALDPALGDATVFIFRHAEKPKDGTALTRDGEKRAEGYADYFTSMKVKKQPVKVTHLFAAADSKNSMRSRLTLEPLGRALKLPVDQRFEADDVKSLAAELRRRDHGKCVVVCWHHGVIPELLKELGVKPAQLLPDGEWPDSVFNWIIELRFDADGKAIPKRSQRYAVRWGK